LYIATRAGAAYFFFVALVDVEAFGVGILIESLEGIDSFLGCFGFFCLTVATHLTFCHLAPLCAATERTSLTHSDRIFNCCRDLFQCRGQPTQDVAVEFLGGRPPLAR